MAKLKQTTMQKSPRLLRPIVKGQTRCSHWGRGNGVGPGGTQRRRWAPGRKNEWAATLGLSSRQLTQGLQMMAVQGESGNFSVFKAPREPGSAIPSLRVGEETKVIQSQQVGFNGSKYPKPKSRLILNPNHIKV